MGEEGRDGGTCCLAYGRGKNEVLKEGSKAEEEFPNGRVQKEVCYKLKGGGR